MQGIFLWADGGGAFWTTIDDDLVYTKEQCLEIDNQGGWDDLGCEERTRASAGEYCGVSPYASACATNPGICR